MALLRALRSQVSLMLPGLLEPRGTAIVGSAGFSRGCRSFSYEPPLSVDADSDDDYDSDGWDEDFERLVNYHFPELLGHPTNGLQNEMLQDREDRNDLVEKYLSLANASTAANKKAQLQEVRSQFARFEGDCGSTEVQVAALTTRISQLAEHLQVHKKDHHSRRGLTALLNQRRKLLVYLRRTDFDRFSNTLSRLNLKDNYAPKDRFSNYDTLKTMKARQAEAKLKQKRNPRK